MLRFIKMTFSKGRQSGSPTGKDRLSSPDEHGLLSRLPSVDILCTDFVAEVDLYEWVSSLVKHLHLDNTHR
jgi:hypothetical protein